jgi:hypothetical protein
LEQVSLTNKELPMLSYPSGLQVSTRALRLLADALRAHRVQLHTQWRALPCGRQALLVLARLHKNETYPDLAAGFEIGVATVCRYVHEALDVLAAMAPTLAQAVQVAAEKAYVVLDGTVIRIDRVYAASGRDGPYYSGKAHAHGMNVQVLADPAGRLIWASPAVPGATNDIRAARDHGILTALTQARVKTFADKAYQGAGPGISVPHRSRRKNPDTGKYLPLSHNQRCVNAAHARLRAPGERANAQLKTWKILRQLHSSPSDTTTVINAVQTLILNG